MPCSSQWANRRCRWVGTQNIDVGRSVATRAVIRSGSKLPAKARRPPASSVPIANRSGALWWIGLSTRLTSSAAKPHRSRSSATSARAAPGSSTPEWTALGRPVVPLVTCIGRPSGSPTAVRRSATAPARPRSGSTTRAGSTSARIRSRSTAVRFGSSGTGSTPAASSPTTVSTYDVEPVSSSATRSPRARGGATGASSQERREPLRLLTEPMPVVEVRAQRASKPPAHRHDRSAAGAGRVRFSYTEGPIDRGRTCFPRGSGTRRPVRSLRCYARPGQCPSSMGSATTSTSAPLRSTVTSTRCPMASANRRLCSDCASPSGVAVDGQDQVAAAQAADRRPGCSRPPRRPAALLRWPIRSARQGQPAPAGDQAEVGPPHSPVMHAARG